MAESILKILLVDDDEVDSEAVERAFKTKKVTNPILYAKNGIEALEILRGNVEKPPLLEPYCILLDLNMPRMNGIELLQALRREKAYETTKVYVFTTSNEERDRLAAAQWNVAGYILKSSSDKWLLHLFDLLDQQWRIIEDPANSSICYHSIL